MSTAAPPEGAAPATLFIDRDLLSRRLDAALREAGIRLVAHGELFADDTFVASTAEIAYCAAKQGVLTGPTTTDAPASHLRMA